MSEILQLSLFLLVLVVLTVIPVMFAARIVRARNTGFWSALAAVILLMVLSLLLERFVPQQGIALAIAVIVGSAIYAFTLGTTWLKGFMVAILSLVIVIGLIVVLTMVLAGIGLTVDLFSF
ncbi:hypothetical protein NFC81_10715 [Salinispirillum sp. LH 10-3-1]|uniref:ABC transporter permease n=1 Tax=Salinispirillum sp. LH 10-3-1 TaxID=2952525 RepID=A0AB38YD53_9GAMM